MGVLVEKKNAGYQFPIPISDEKTERMNQLSYPGKMHSQAWKPDFLIPAPQFLLLNHTV